MAEFLMEEEGLDERARNAKRKRAADEAFLQQILATKKASVVEQLESANDDLIVIAFRGKECDVLEWLRRVDYTVLEALDCDGDPLPHHWSVSVV
jgi:hypothetical protein